MDDRLGHKTPDCQGQWIDVSTLTSPGRELCLACRATRINRGGDDELEFDASTPVPQPLPLARIHMARARARIVLWLARLELFTGLPTEWARMRLMGYRKIDGRWRAAQKERT